MPLFDISYLKNGGPGILTESVEFGSREAAQSYGQTVFGEDFVEARQSAQLPAPVSAPKKKPGKIKRRKKYSARAQGRKHKKPRLCNERLAEPAQIKPASVPHRHPAPNRQRTPDPVMNLLAWSQPS